jgi:hypothetical protein
MPRLISGWLQRILKERIMIYFTITSPNIKGGTEENNAKIKHNHSPGWDSNLGPTKYETKVLPIELQHSGFEVLTAVVIQNSIFWDITPCSTLNVNQCFAGTYRLHLHGWRVSHAWNLHEAGSKQMETICSCGKLVDFRRLHSIIFQKMELFTSFSYLFLFQLICNTAKLI